MALKGKDILVFLSIKYQGDWNSIYQAIKNKELVDETQVQEAISKIDDKIVTIIDEDYPEMLKKIYKPPFVVYYKGNLSLLNKNNVGIIGTGNFSHETAKRLNTLLRETKLKYPGITYATINNSGYEEYINTTYSNEAILVLDREVRSYDKEKLVISEYPSGSPMNREHRPWAMRILAGVTNAMLIPEVKRKEDALIGAGYALYLNKSIGVFLQPKDKEDATHQLQEDGAKIILSAVDVFELTQLVAYKKEDSVPKEMQ